MTFMAYHVDITEFPEGRFRAMCRDTGAFVISTDPEHEWCYAMADEPDGPVQFYRDGVPSLSHSSIHKMGQMRIGLGRDFPYRRAYRSKWQGKREPQNGGVHADV